MVKAPEKWRAIKGYEGYYEISSCGRVRSVQRTVKTKKGTRTYCSRLIKNILNPYGYHVVRLCKHNEQRTLFVHRLVLETFVKSCPDGMECRHLNGIRTDNNVLNLKWGTDKENANDRNAHGTNYTGKEHPLYKPLDGELKKEIRSLLLKGATWKEIESKFGLGRKLIKRRINFGPKFFSHLNENKTYHEEKTSRGYKGKGESHYRARVTENQVLKIRKLWEQKYCFEGHGSMTRLAKAVGVPVNTTIAIVRRKSWKHL